MAGVCSASPVPCGETLPMRLARIQKIAKGAWKALVLFFSLLDVLARFAILRLRHRNALSLERRAEWLHSACRTITRRLSMSISASGSLPAGGLVLSNHLSYLDILFYASLMPCIFVSKSEVLSWPLFGILARCGGTIFVERDRAHGVGEPAEKMAGALRLGVPVILFPEGTSTDGSTVLPFRSALLQPAITTRTPIVSAAVAYSLADGIEADLCYYGEITFFPHLLGALSRTGIEARIAFDCEARVYPDRKIAAQAAWQRVAALREGLGVPQSV
jgi:lyso-ornithine lipid O-acyltransferase